jgi:dihydroneopterin aldolase
MRDVFSYDPITDSIRMIVAQEHIALVEMLAERIAAVVLTHPRVASATGLGRKARCRSGPVGVEIVRDARPRPRRCIICSRLPPRRRSRQRGMRGLD